MAALWRGGRAADGRSREVTNGSFVAAKLTEGPRASAAASGKSGCPVWVDTSSWQDGEAAVRPCLTLERQVTNTLLPDCAIKPPAAEADDLPEVRRSTADRSRIGYLPFALARISSLYVS